MDCVASSFSSQLLYFDYLHSIHIIPTCQVKIGNIYIIVSMSRSLFLIHSNYIYLQCLAFILCLYASKNVYTNKNEEGFDAFYSSWYALSNK